MITIEKSRKLLGDLGKSMSDEKIEKLRSEVYELAGMALDSYIESKTKQS